MIKRRKPQFLRLKMVHQQFKETAKTMAGTTIPTWIHRLRQAHAEEFDAMVEAAVVARLRERFKDV